MNKVEYRLKIKDTINYIIWRIGWQTPHWEFPGS
jgi:hypothetical protein